VKEKKDGAPKRSPSAFFLFVKSKRPLIKDKYPDMPNTMVVKTCSELWKELSESEKIPFQEEEKKLRAQYHIEANIWKKSKNEKKSWKNDEALEKEMLPLPEAAPHPPGASVFMNPPSYAPRNDSALAVASPAAPSRSRKRKRDRHPNAPKRSPPAFFLFVNHCRSELKMQYPELRHTELVKMLGQKWSEMLDEEKRPFRDHEEQLRQQYHIDIKNYKKGAVPEEDYHGNIPIMKSQQVEPPRVQHSYHQELVYQNPVAQTQPEEDLGYRNFFATDM